MAGSKIKKSEALNTMLASEEVLRKEWDLPEEDEAWEHLQERGLSNEKNDQSSKIMVGKAPIKKSYKKT